MKYYALVNEAGYLQVRHDATDTPHGEEIEVSEEVAKEPGFYEIKDKKVERKPKKQIDKMLQNRQEHLNRMSRLESLLKGGA